MIPGCWGIAAACFCLLIYERAAPWARIASLAAMWTLLYALWEIRGRRTGFVSLERTTPETSDPLPTRGCCPHCGAKIRFADRPFAHHWTAMLCPSCYLPVRLDTTTSILLRILACVPAPLAVGIAYSYGLVPEPASGPLTLAAILSSVCLACWLFSPRDCYWPRHVWTGPRPRLDDILREFEGRKKPGA